MEIKTKFDCGDMVYFIVDSNIEKRIIDDISYHYKKITYHLYKDQLIPSKILEESLCFASVDELVEYYVNKLDVFDN